MAADNINGPQETGEPPEWMQALEALRIAKEEVIKLHLKSGLPIVIWRNGAVYLQPPDEAQREFEEAKRLGWKIPPHDGQGTLL
jgi:hypothetical protein